MAEEFMGAIESNETGGASSEKVSEVAIQKVQEEARQAKKVAQQLKKDKAINDKFAQFLSYLMNEITNEHIIKGIYDTFFTTLDYKTNITYLRKNMNTIVVVGVFYPFFQEKGDELGLDQVFAKILEPRNGFSIREYVQYLQKISDHYHDNIPLNQGSFITLLIEIIKEYMKHASDVPALKEGEIDEEAYKNLTYQYLHE
ncbi:MAG: hypothetical protein PHU61_02615 [Candidatus Absconditabacteria bacterium]|nr:hypothetical protein [Candidatus Absconditabacteria bacterium]MDD3868136.1 hypothetical protein [Candidatus Absconditabacteria bacterium]MDD4714522.1 hypothetical protein [Candidatus Absconditabacteria bacterium]